VSASTRREMARAALEALNASWEAFAVASPEYWEAANARLSAAMALADATLRDLKRAAGYPVRGTDYRLPWLTPVRPRPQSWARAS
jgi:hypothetical protein